MSTGTSCFGVEWLRGRRREPVPPDKISAFMVRISCPRLTPHDDDADTRGSSFPVRMRRVRDARVRCDHLSSSRGYRTAAGMIKGARPPYAFRYPVLPPPGGLLVSA
ncbi:hypothetical protein GCM10009546_06520 [Actinomadura livida]|uniref:Uncharacterized protein n=1 Tax=Actinomadura livida TaxID=79909 RepID=A0ABN1DM67_9ACTN|nr:hypothetical protein GCM10010208_55340 [Actinomadura livida]